MATDSELLVMRPRLRNDAVFLRVDTGVYLRHSESACVLKGRLVYQWISALGPRMNGEHTLAELCAGLDDDQRRTVLRLTGALLERGFVRAVPSLGDTAPPPAVPARFRPQVGLIEHLAGAAGDAPAVRFGRFRSARALVTGPAPVLAAAVRGLVRNGMAEVGYVTPADDDVDVAGTVGREVAELRAADVPATVTALPAGDAVPWSGHDIVIAAAEGAGIARLLGLSRALVRAGRRAPRLLPVVIAGERLVLGPLSGTTQGPCWLCAQLRLGANGDPAAAADLWRELALGRAVDRRARAGGTVAEMIGNAAALETFRLFTGQLSAAGERDVVVQDAVTLESVRETLLPHPECPLCREAANRPPGRSAKIAPGTPGTGGGPAAAPAPVTVRVPAAEAGTSADGTDEQVYERAAGLVSPRLGVLSGWADETLEQVPLKIGRVRVTGAGALAGGRRAFTGFHTETLMGARLAALRAALSWYAGTCPDRPDIVTGAPPELAAAGHQVVAGPHLPTWSGLRPGDDAPRAYVPAVSLAGGSAALVPHAAVYPFSAADRHAAFERTPAGAAAGASRGEIVAAGLAGALAYRGLLRAIRGIEPGRALPDAVAAGDEEARFARDGLARLGLGVRVYALPAAAPAYAVLAVAGERPAWSVGAALSARDAVRAALRDVLGQAQALAAEGTPPDLGDPLLAGFDPRTAWAAGDADPAVWAAGAATGLDEALTALASAGVEAYLVDTTPPDLRAAAAIGTGTVLLAERPDHPG